MKCSERNLRAVVNYHERTKHRFGRYAAGPGYLDWATQPEPFRFYEGAPRLLLRRQESKPEQPPYYDDLYGNLSPTSFHADAIATLFYHSFALSAWKSASGACWSLRCHPSSGNLHPTEVYLLVDGVPGLSEKPALYHYQPFWHGLEVRADLSDVNWQAFLAPLRPPTFLIGFTSIHWRESWKYGERALRYCLLDLGHAMASLSYSAACLGWKCALLPLTNVQELAGLLGVNSQEGTEAEHPDCLVAVFPDGEIDWGALRNWPPATDRVANMAGSVRGDPPNCLSPTHRSWPVIHRAASALDGGRIRLSKPVQHPFPGERVRQLGARWLIRHRRSVQRMDGTKAMSRVDFERILARLWHNTLPVSVLGWEPRVHLGFYLHRVRGLVKGLYFFPRTESGLHLFKTTTTRRWAWQKQGENSRNLPFYLLQEGDARQIAKTLSCHQDIASDGAFAVSMLAEFEPGLAASVWEYARCHMEAGALGQLLYLEAEAAGFRGTGVGCFFDDPVHDLFGLSDRTFQVLYHFTVGGGLEDKRLQSLDAYHHLEET